MIVSWLNGRHCAGNRKLQFQLLLRVEFLRKGLRSSSLASLVNEQPRTMHQREKCNLQNKSDWAECPFCKQVVHLPSGVSRSWFEVFLLSPLRPTFRNNNPLHLKFLKNAFTGKRILQRPTPRHLRATDDRPRMRYPTCQQLPWCPAHGHAATWPAAQRRIRLW